MMRIEDEHFGLVNKLSERHNGETPDDRMRQIAREEADKRISALVGPVFLIAALWWANREYGREGLLVGLALGFAWFMWTVFRMDFDPQHERHLIVIQAEDLNRLHVITETYNAGDACWSIHEKEYERDTKKIVATDGPRWDGSWKRIYNDALEMQSISPRKRGKKLMKAALAAKPALMQGKEIAKRENAELTFWASSFLQRLERV